MFDDKGFPPDPNNPGWVLCWACYSLDPWHLIGVYTNEQDALNVLEDQGKPYLVERGSWKVGTKEFIGSAID